MANKYRDINNSGYSIFFCHHGKILYNLTQAELLHLYLRVILNYLPNMQTEFKRTKWDSTNDRFRRQRRCFKIQHSSSVVNSVNGWFEANIARHKIKFSNSYSNWITYSLFFLTNKFLVNSEKYHPFLKSVWQIIKKVPSKYIR